MYFMLLPSLRSEINILFTTCSLFYLLLYKFIFYVFFYLQAPARAFYLLWVNFLGPWFFQEDVQEVPDEKLDKKQRKLERKMKYVYR